MKFQLIGVNHKSAPVAVRERLAIPESRLPDACRQLAEQPGVDEAMILCTCSPGADYPTPFPAVNNMPPPRSDTRLDANQVQQATEDLISARDRLSTEAQGSQNKSASKPPAKTAAKTSAKPAPSAAAKNKPASLTPASARQPLKSDTGEAADAETK